MHELGIVSSLHQGIWNLSSVDSARRRGSGVRSVTAWVDRLHRGIERRLLHGWILHWGIMCAYLKKINSPLRQRYLGSRSGTSQWVAPVRLSVLSRVGLGD